MYDIAVIGGGPAGLSAAVQARVRNKSVVVISGNSRDNPLYKTARIENYLGVPQISGPELLERFRTHAQQLGAAQKEGRVLNIMPMGGTFYLSIGSEMEQVKAIVLATGVIWANAQQLGAAQKEGRVLNIMPMGGTFYLSIGSEMEQVKAIVLATGVIWANKYPGEEAHLGRGVSYCATCDGMLYRGKSVVVVGKAADSPQEANYLRELGCLVTYVSDKTPDGLRPDIPFVKAARVEITGGGSGVEALRAGSVTLPCEGVFILRPSVAPADLLPGLALEDGYIRVDRNMATSIPGVFAAGDCTGLPLQVSKAVGEGLVAGLRAAEYTDHI